MMKYFLSFLTFLWVVLPFTVSAQATADKNMHLDKQMLTHKLMQVWMAPCDLEHGKETSVPVRFTLTPDGNLQGEPEWSGGNGEAVWREAANRAIAAVKKAQPYTNLPADLYNHPITIYFDAQKACQGR